MAGFEKALEKPNTETDSTPLKLNQVGAVENTGKLFGYMKPSAQVATTPTDDNVKNNPETTK